MKVLMISTDRSVFDLASNTRERMIAYGELVDELHIIVFSKKELGYKDAQISRHTHIYPTDSKSKLKYIRDAVSIGREVGKVNKIDLVTAQDPFEAGLAGVRIARALHSHLELQIHTDPFSTFFKRANLLNRLRVLIAKRILPKADCIRVVSPLLKKSVLKYVPRVGKRGICFTVLPIFVLPFSDAVQDEPELTLPDIKNQILFVGRLEKEKNLTLALKAFARVASKHKDVAFVLVGDGSERESLLAKARSLGVEHRVVFVGFRKNPAPYYRAASIVILTSNYEGAGRILMEAALEGKAIVSTSVGVAPLLLDEEDKQFLCPVGDEKAVTKALATLLEHEQVRRESGMRIQSRAHRVVVSSKEDYLRALSGAWDKCVSLKQK